MEPVDVGAVDNGWELTSPDPECGTHRGEAEHNLEAEEKGGRDRGKEGQKRGRHVMRQREENCDLS